MEEKNLSAEEIIWKCSKGCNASTFNKSTRKCNECGSCLIQPPTKKKFSPHFDFATIVTVAELDGGRQ